VLRTHTPSETKRLGARLGRLLRPGDVLLLQGELGSGKTTLTQGIGQGLRVAEPVKSPSFVLMNEYHGRLPVYHADLFRLTDPGEVVDLALEDVASDGVLIVEWPDRAWQEMPQERLLIVLEETSAKERALTCEARGSRYDQLVQRLRDSHE
jgi:tRNA threonylcarbamoyladenosine biosynthesis protein TsaE